MIAIHVIDSIIKRIGGEYLKIMAGNILPLFSQVFKSVNFDKRMKLIQLRQTWDEILHPYTLYQIDKAINLMHPSWDVGKIPHRPMIEVNLTVL